MSLAQISSILSNEPESYKKMLKKHLDKGLSYSVSRSNAIEEYAGTFLTENQFDYKEILSKSNNILGIEYLKAINKINSKIKPVSIKRLGSSYNELDLSKGFASATGIRNMIKKEGINSVKSLVPMETYYCLEEYLNKYNAFNYLENYNQILLYLILTTQKERIASLIDIENGLENRIKDFGAKSNDIIEIINSIVSKRYPRTRIQRLFVHLLNNLYNDNFKQFYQSYPSYIRVLGANKNGLLLLKKIKESSSLPIITKFADHKHLKNKELENILMYDKKATDLFFLGLNHPNLLSNMDYLTSPYIK